MKHTGKRTLGLLLALAVLFTLLPAVTLTASAADKYEHIYITGKASWLSAEWSLGTDEMTRVEENLYKKSFTNTGSGEVWFKFTNGDWGTCWGWDTGCVLDEVHRTSLSGGNLYFANLTAPSFTIWFDLRGDTPYFCVSTTNDDLISYDVYFTPESGVSGPVYFHEWNNYISHDSWPGAQMIAQANGSYKTTVTQYWDAKGIIIDGGNSSWQTDDITSFTLGKPIEIKDQGNVRKGSAVIVPAGTVATVTAGGTTTCYDDFDAAVAAWTAASDGTLKLLDNAYHVADYTFVAQTGDTLTLDLNGYAVTGDIPVLVYGGDLTVTDSSAAQTGSIVGTTTAVYGFAGNFTLEGGTIGSDTASLGIFAQTAYPMGITLNGGSVLCGSSPYVDDQNQGDNAIYLDGDDVSLTVNGATVGSQTANCGIYICDGGSATVTSGDVLAKEYAIAAFAGSVAVNGGTVQSCTTNEASAIQISRTASCTISGGDIISSGTGVYVGDYQNPTAGSKSLSMTGGTITAAAYGVASNGTHEENITIDISGGTITGSDAAIFSPNRGETVTISGTATLNGGTGIAVKGGTVNITGGTINGTGAYTAAAAQNSGATVTGDAIYVEDNYGAAFAPTVNISGGTFNSTNGYAVQYYSDETDATAATGVITITDGTFTSTQPTAEYNGTSLEEKIIISGGLYSGEPDADNILPGKIAVQVTGGWTIGDSYIKGFSLSLKGDIAVNYFIDLGALDPAATSITFSWPGDSATYEFSTLTKDASGCYKIPVNVAAKQMNDTITAQIKQGATVIETNHYSVAKYATRIVANAGGEFDSFAHLTELQTLCEAMLVYGAKAQLKFTYNTGSLASNADPTALTDAEKGALGAYGTADLSPFGLSFTSSSLVLESNTVHRLYFDVTDAAALGATTITCGTKTLTAVVDGNTAYVDIPNIAARNVLKNYTVTFTSGANTAKLRVNAGAYIKNALGGTDDALKAVVTALYRYSTAAEAYFAVK